MKNDTAYNNRDFIPGAEAYPERWAEEARQFRELEAAVGRARLNTAYGDHPREHFDLFHPAGLAEGLAVFVHGGYWRLFDRSYWSHFAAGATARGWAVAIPSYPLAPEVGITEITQSVARAVATAAGYVKGPVALAGHSAGGHLVARMACRDVLPPGIAGRLHRIVPISPLSDLRPFLETTMNEDLQLDEAEAITESPALQEKAVDVPVSVWVGGDERPALLDQARWLGEAWEGTEVHVVPGRHHFDVIDALRDPGSGMVRALLG